MLAEAVKGLWRQAGHCQAGSRLECDVGFRQHRMRRRTRPGQLCANFGSDGCEGWQRPPAAAMAARTHISFGLAPDDAALDPPARKPEPVDSPEQLC
jgi:hypothetical protein